MPSEALQISWRANPTRRADNFGAALVAPVLRRTKADTLGSRLMGGARIEAMVVPTALHQGRANLNLVDVEAPGYTNMWVESIYEGDGPPSPPSPPWPIEQFTQIFPSYIDSHAPVEPTNPCSHECSSDAGPEEECVQLTLQPGFLRTTKTWQTSNVLIGLAAALGGIYSVRPKRRPLWTATRA